MYGVASFGTLAFAARPQAYRAFVDAHGLAAAQAGMQGLGAALVSSSGLLGQAGLIQGGLVAVRGASATLVQDSVLTGLASIVWNATGLLAQAAPVLGAGAAVVSAHGSFEASATILGYRLRAYDQLFPANVANGDQVQIGPRLFEWRANTGRWRPAGPA